MASQASLQTIVDKLMEHFGQSECMFIEVFSKFMIGSQTAKVINIAAIYGHVGYDTKNNLKTGLRTHNVAYNLDTSARSHAYYVDVSGLKVLLARIGKKSKYEEMERFLYDQSLPGLPLNSFDALTNTESGIVEVEPQPPSLPQPREAETPRVPNRQRPALISFTGYIDHHSAQFYARETDGDFIDVYPIGRPDLMLP